MSHFFRLQFPEATKTHNIFDPTHTTIRNRTKMATRSRAEADSEDAASSSGDSSSVSASSDPSTTRHTMHSESTKVSLTHYETKAVNRSKMLVYLALLLAAIGVGVTTYFLAHQAEVNDFETGVSGKDCVTVWPRLA